MQRNEKQNKEKKSFYLMEAYAYTLFGGIPKWGFSFKMWRSNEKGILEICFKHLTSGASSERELHAWLVWVLKQ